MDTGGKVSESPDVRKSSFPLVFPPREGQGGQTYLPACCPGAHPDPTSLALSQVGGAARHRWVPPIPIHGAAGVLPVPGGSVPPSCPFIFGVAGGNAELQERAPAAGTARVRGRETRSAVIDERS